MNRDEEIEQHIIRLKKLETQHKAACMTYGKQRKAMQRTDAKILLLLSMIRAERRYINGNHKDGVVK